MLLELWTLQKLNVGRVCDDLYLLLTYTYLLYLRQPHSTARYISHLIAETLGQHLRPAGWGPATLFRDAWLKISVHMQWRYENFIVWAMYYCIV